MYLLNWILNFYSFHTICKLINHHLVSDFTMKPTFFMISFPRGFKSLHGVFRDHACMAWWQSHPFGRLSVDVYWSKPRSLDRLEQQNWVTFATVLLEFLRKSVKFVSSRLQKCVLNWWGLRWNFTLHSNVWSLKWCRNCSSIAVCLGDAAIQHCVPIVQYNHPPHINEKIFCFILSVCTWIFWCDMLNET
jgi:hypothetical protein